MDVSGKHSLSERIKILLNQSTTDDLLTLNYEEGILRLSGFVGKPQSASKQNQKQYLFINNRQISDRMISLSVKEAFGTLLPHSSTPIFVLHLFLPPEIVDVNVHPRKEQVAFINSKEIFTNIKEAITQVLNENNLTFNLAKFKYESSARIGETTSLAGELLKESVLPWNRDEKIDFKPSDKLLQIHQTYILSENQQEIFFIDQHAAHERILYEEFVSTFEKDKKHAFELPKPSSLSLSIIEADLLDENKISLEKAGFIMEHFQGNNYLVRKIPVVFRGRNIEKVIKDILSDLKDDTIKSIDTQSQRMLAFLACRAAVKRGDVLTQKQMKDLVTKLTASPNNITCPHGRPTKIQVSIEELDRLFKR